MNEDVDKALKEITPKECLPSHCRKQRVVVDKSGRRAHITQ